MAVPESLAMAHAHSIRSVATVGEVDAVQRFSLQRARAIVWRNRLLILPIIGACVLGALLLTLIATRYYVAQGSVEISEQTEKVLENETAQRMTPADLFTFLQTQVDILKSRYLSEQVVRRLQLSKQPQALKLLRIDEAKLPTSEGKRISAIAATLSEQVSVNLPRNSQIVEVSFSTPDPKLSADLTNAYLEAFAAANLSRRIESSSYARQFLQDQLAEAQQSLEDSERAALAYARQAGLLDTSNSGVAASGGGGPATLSITTNDLVQQNAALNAARQQRIDAEEKWRAVAGQPLLSLSQVQSNLAIQRLQEQRAIAEADYRALRERYTDAYPTVVQAQERVKEIERQIAQIAGNIRDTVRQEFRSAAAAEAALQQQVNSLRGATLSEQDRSVEYNILRRKADTDRQVYDSLLQRLREVSQEAQLGSNNVTILDRAVEPQKPSSPRPLLNLALGIILGLVLAALALLARERLDNKIRDPRRVEDYFRLPLLGIIPTAASGSEASEQVLQPRSALSEAYQSLTNTVRLNCPPGNGSHLFVTSSRASEGKSLTSFALAQNLARAGERVLLVDADLRRGRIRKLMGAGDVEKGLSEILSGQAKWSDAVVKGPVDFISSGDRPANPALLLAHDAFANFLDEVRGAYDHIVLDGPPMLGLADAQIIGGKSDITIYVVEAGSTTRTEVSNGLRRLSLANANPLGLVVTKFDPKEEGYGEYGYNYYSYEDAADPEKAA